MKKIQKKIDKVKKYNIKILRLITNCGRKMNFYYIGYYDNNEKFITVYEAETKKEAQILCKKKYD